MAKEEKESYFATLNPVHCRHAILTIGGKCIFMSELLTCKSDEAEKEAIERMKKQEED